MNNIIFPSDTELDWANLVKNKTRELGLIPRGQRVVVRLPNTPILAATMIAGFESGLVMVPLDPRIEKNRYDFILEHSGAAAEITIDGIKQYGEQDRSPLDDRLLIYTSGTTGNPKGVVLTADSIKNNANAVSALHAFDQKNHATCLPMWHVNALCMSLFGSYFSNGTMLLLEKFDAQIYFEMCSRFNVKTASLVPTLIHKLLKDHPAWPQSLEYIITAAAPLSQILQKNFINFTDLAYVRDMD